MMAAGFHLPGTVHAVKLLSNPECFCKRPLGGIIKVRIDGGLPWHLRIEKSRVEFETPVYDLAQAEEALRKLAESDEPDWPGTREEALALVKVVQAIASTG
jgi:hypothetical protein